MAGGCSETVYIQTARLIWPKPYLADIRPTEIGITNFKSYYAQRLNV